MTTSTTRNGNGCISNSVGPWKHPELDSPSQRAKWDRAAAKPEVIHLRFLGEPAPQGSKQISRWGGLREVSKKIQPWRASVQYACAEQFQGDPITEAVAMEVTFILPRAKNHYGTGRNATKLKGSAPTHHTKTPDLDKLLRGVLDPMTVKCGGNVLNDDSQIVELLCSKRYATAGESIGALVSIRIVR